ncbi:MAG: PIN domain-containing protein [Candidatus Doudnabacteria bacterium]|nr:PIN domain-containing protein [Candidatus Doudnabacteria bacterium]
MGQIIGLDTSIFIYAFEDLGAVADASVSILKEIETGRSVGVFSLIGMIELFTGPKIDGNYGLAAEYKNRLYNYPNLLIINLSDDIADIASSLRAEYGLLTPDAIHIATAIDSGADRFITNDKSLKKVKEIKIELL